MREEEKLGGSWQCVSSLCLTQRRADAPKPGRREGERNREGGERRAQGDGERCPDGEGSVCLEGVFIKALQFLTQRHFLGRTTVCVCVSVWLCVCLCVCVCLCEGKVHHCNRRTLDYIGRNSLPLILGFSEDSPSSSSVSAVRLCVDVLHAAQGDSGS